MAFYFLPAGGKPDITNRIELEGTVYDFRFKWNSYNESWKLFIGLTGQDPLIETKLTTNRDLLKPFRYIEDLPKGILYLFDTSLLQARCDFDNLGKDKRFRLTYIESGDLA